MSNMVEIVETLLEKTREGKINWEEFSQDSYYVPIGNSTVMIEEAAGRIIHNGAYRKAIIASLRNKSGRTLEELQTNDGGHYGLVELYELARKKALGIDDAVANVTDILKRL